MIDYDLRLTSLQITLGDNYATLDCLLNAPFLMNAILELTFF